MAEHARAGRNVIVSTPAASGKSLGYLMPALTAVLDGGTALYLTPTKALAADQPRARSGRCGCTGCAAAVLDAGDTAACGRPQLGQDARLLPGHHPGHAAPGAAARARPLGPVPVQAAVRHRGRVPRIPGRVRLARGAGAAQAAPDRRLLRRGPGRTGACPAGQARRTARRGGPGTARAPRCSSWPRPRSASRPGVLHCSPGSTRRRSTPTPPRAGRSPSRCGSLRSVRCAVRRARG